jgi:hypothetical protein
VRAMLVAFVHAWAPSADPACAETAAADPDDGGRS